MLRRTNSTPFLPHTFLPPVQMPRSEGADHAIAIAELKSCGHTENIAQALLEMPGYAEAHRVVFLQAPHPLADGANLSGLLEPLCVVCDAWLRHAYARESCALLEGLLRHYPQASAALDLLKAHVDRVLGGVSHEAPNILAATQACLLQPDLSQAIRPKLIELANHLHPATGLKLELLDLRRRLRQAAPPGSRQPGAEPAQQLLALCLRAHQLHRQQPDETLLALAENIAEEIEQGSPPGGEGAEGTALRRINSLKWRHRRERTGQQQHRMLPWLKLSIRCDEQAQTPSLDLAGCLVAVPQAWGNAERATAWNHFVQWTTGQLEDPQGLPWADLAPLFSHVVGALTQKNDSAWTSQMFQLACRESLPVNTRRQLVLSLIPKLRSSEAALDLKGSPEAHATCLRAIGALCEAAPALGAGLFEAYRQQAQRLKCLHPAFEALIQQTMAVLSHPPAPDHDTLVAWTRAYATLSLRPDGSPWGMWRSVCRPLLRRWVVATRHNPWAHELFLQALRTLGMPQSLRSPLLSAVPAQAELLLDQLAYLPTPQERAQWLLELDRLCATDEARQDLGDTSPAARDERHRLCALRGTIRHLLSRAPGNPSPSAPGPKAPVDPAIAFFDQWADLTLTLAPRKLPEARTRLQAMAEEHARLSALGPRFSDEMDKLVTQLMAVQKGRFESALQ